MIKNVVQDKKWQFLEVREDERAYYTCYIAQCNWVLLCLSHGKDGATVRDDGTSGSVRCPFIQTLNTILFSFTSALGIELRSLCLYFND